jgi:hypothetical protein
LWVVFEHSLGEWTPTAKRGRSAPISGFAKAIQESTPEAQREVVQRVFQRIAITDNCVTDVDVYPVYAEALRWYWRPIVDALRTAVFRLM